MVQPKLQPFPVKELAPPIHNNPKLAHQINLEQLYSDNQTIPRIRKEFTSCKSFNFKKHMQAHEINESFGFSLLVQMVLHKRTSLPIIVGILRRHFKDEPNACQLATDMLLRCVLADLVDWNPTSEQLVVKYDISPDVQADLDRYQFPLPMVIRPQLVTDNTQTGYVIGKGSIILRNNHHDDDVCLDHINRVNSIRFCLDHDVARMIALLVM